jgi:putative sterol carrier protein
MLVFSPEWAALYHEAINQNASYLAASQKWEEGQVALVMTAPTEKAVLLDLWHGVCRSATAVDVAQATESATFVISGEQGVWQQVLSGKLQPLLAIMSGKLKLTKGSIGRLLPYTKAANELVLSAQTVPTDFE